MALPATDSFTGTDGTALDTYSSNWTTEGGAFDIQSNALASNQASTRTMARWNADTFDDAQYAQGTLVNMTQSGRYIGVATRVASGANNGYHYLFTSTGGWFLLDVTGGSGSVVASGTESSPAGKVIRLESNGDQHECIYDGSPVTGSPFTNASYSSGSAGVSGYHDTASNRLDDWEGGNLGGSVGGATLSGRISLLGVGV